MADDFQLFRKSVRFFFTGILLSALFACAGCSRLSSRTFSSRMTRTQNDWRSSGFRLQGPAQVMPGGQGALQSLMNRLTEVSPLRGYLVPVMISSSPKINAATDGHLVYV